MAKISASISIDADIKVKAQELFADFGMDLSTAVNIFLRQAVRENAIPFAIQREVPNRDTVAAMKVQALRHLLPAAPGHGGLPRCLRSCPPTGSERT